MTDHPLKGRAVLAAVGLAAVALPAAAQDLCGRPREAPDAVYNRLTKAEKLKESFRDRAYAAVNDETKGVVWTFTVPGHPAHPSVVCRHIVNDGSDMRLETQVQCNASEAECERLVKAFQELNHPMLQEMKKQQRNSLAASCRRQGELSRARVQISRTK